MSEEYASSAGEQLVSNKTYQLRMSLGLNPETLFLYPLLSMAKKTHLFLK